MLFCIYNKCGRNYRLLERESAAMNRNIEKWLENNPPRIELTELEKNFEFDRSFANKYVAYFDNFNGDDIYRVREYLPGEREGLPEYLRDELDGYYVILCRNYSKFGFNILGYSVRDLDHIRSRFNLFMRV